MKIHRLFLLSSLSLFCLTAFVNCGQVTFNLDPKSKNTVAGNPFVANKIAESICGVLRRCHPNVNFQACVDDVNQVPGFGAPLQLSKSYDTLTAIAAGEITGILRGDQVKADACVAKIDDIQCSSALVDAAYNALSSSPYAGSVQMVSSENCGELVEPTAKYVCDSKVFVRGANNGVVSPGAVPADAVFSVSPSLPAGLNLDSRTGVISGTPQVATAMTSYAVSMTWSGQSTSNQIRIQTGDGYLVNDFGDATNAGGSTCQTANGVCSLRAAVEAANTSNGRLIVVPAGTYAVNSVLRILRPMEIHGSCEAPTIVDGQASTKVFSIEAGPTTLSRLTIQNGAVTNSAGAGITVYTDTDALSVNFDHLVVRANRINSAPNGTSDGAGIHVYSERASAPIAVSLKNSTIADNINDNGWYGAGMGLWFYTHADIENCVFSGNQNTQSYGGGLSTRSGSLNVSQSLFINNSSPRGEGGAVYINQQAASVSNFTNVTFANNLGQLGGGLYVGGAGSVIRNSTFSGNISTDANYGGALSLQAGATVYNTIFSGNRSGSNLRSCSDGQLITSGGNNLSDGPAAQCNLGANDFANTQALLGPLQGNGGTTQTMALFPDSPAVGQGNPATCATVDQRGVARLSDGRCDIGAYEFQ